MRKQALQFRKDEATYVMQRWSATTSVSLVGVGSVGKSNLLHHLADADTINHYLSANANIFPINIDPNLLVPLSETDSIAFRCWAGYELLMHRLYMSFYPFDILGDEAEHFYEAYQMLQDGANPLHTYMGLRYFELGLEFFLRRNIKIVFMFDEFEELARKLPAKFFQTLRGLRDNHKSGLSFLTFSREPLHILINRFNLSQEEMEPFIELFNDNIYYVGPYNETDARSMLDNLQKQNPRLKLSPNQQDSLLQISGRFAGILRASFNTLGTANYPDLANLDGNQILERLIRRPQIQAECDIIWNWLTSIEQYILKSLAKKKRFDTNEEIEQAVTLLVHKRLLRVDRARETLTVEPPIFGAYLNNLKD